MSLTLFGFGLAVVLAILFIVTLNWLIAAICGSVALSRHPSAETAKLSKLAWYAVGFGLLAFVSFIFVSLYVSVPEWILLTYALFMGFGPLFWGLYGMFKTPSGAYAIPVAWVFLNLLVAAGSSLIGKAPSINIDGQLVAFALIATIILGGGLWSSLAVRTFHAALGLGVALVGVASLFVYLGAPFIGVVQILVYVGGILTLLIFAVMFVAGDEEEEVYT